MPRIRQREQMVPALPSVGWQSGKFQLLHFHHVFSMSWRKLSNSPVCLLLGLPQRAPCLLLSQGVREGHQAWTPSHLIPKIQGGTTKPIPSPPRIPSLASKACFHLSSTTNFQIPDCYPGLAWDAQNYTERLCEYSRCRLQSKHCWNVWDCARILLWG